MCSFSASGSGSVDESTRGGRKRCAVEESAIGDAVSKKIESGQFMYDYLNCNKFIILPLSIKPYIKYNRFNCEGFPVYCNFIEKQP